ncbi:hypothetical protein BC940DRAFT_155626 [Gongronella butleri]|nr:hypothetical protein BC940DRAFT_155626 [Gongronella butleri]
MLDPGVTKDILERLPEWKLGLTPSGELAKEPCFVQQRLPRMVRLVSENTTATLVTTTTWTSRLVEHGVVWDTSNDTSLRSLAMLQLVFYPQQHLDTVEAKTLHMLLHDTCAWFPVNHILRPTKKFQRAIERALQPNDPRQALLNLIHVFHTFGFLWPQRIILGRRLHVRKSYRSRQKHALLQLRMAKDDVMHKMHKERANFVHPYGSDDDEQESLTWTIIKRNDVCPIYEFLDDRWRRKIEHVIQACLYRVPLHRPFKLRHQASHRYLCWSADAAGTFQFATADMEAITSSQSQYLWRFTGASMDAIAGQLSDDDDDEVCAYVAFPDLQVTYQSPFLRCGAKLFLSPACMTHASITGHPNSPGKKKDTSLRRTFSLKRNNEANGPSNAPTRVLLPTHTMVLTRSRRAQLQTRPLVLQDKALAAQAMAHDAGTLWTVELPGLGMARDDDAATDERLNVDILIGRLRPILHGDFIALRQVHYLAAVPPAPPPEKDQANAQSSQQPQAQQPGQQQGQQQAKNQQNQQNRQNQQRQSSGESISDSDLPWDVAAMEHGALLPNSMVYWCIEKATDDDLARHHQTYVEWPVRVAPPSPAPRASKSAETTASRKTPTLRRVQSFYHKSATTVHGDDDDDDDALFASAIDADGIRGADDDDDMGPDDTTTSREPLSTADDSIMSTPGSRESRKKRAADDDSAGFSMTRHDFEDSDALDNDRAAPYLRYYASKRNSHLLADLWRSASLKKVLARFQPANTGQAADDHAVQPPPPPLPHH